MAGSIVNTTGAPMIGLVTPRRGAGHHGTQIVGSALSGMDKARHRLINGVLNMMKGLILSALMVCVVVSLVRHPPGAVFNNRDDHRDAR